jgi:hypothetical protein
MIKNIGFGASAGVSTAMIVAVSILPTILLQWKGRRWQKRSNKTGESYHS